MVSIPEEDVRLYYQWKDTGSKEDFQNIYRQMLPVINKASMKASYTSQIPQSIFKLEAAQQFHDSLQRFDPNYGVKLSTYLHKNIEEKLKRVNSTYQNIARIPERTSGGVFDINKLLNAEVILRDKLNRQPSDVELAEDLKMTVDNVGKLRRELRRDLSLNAELEDLAVTGDLDSAKEIEHLVYYDLPPEAQLVYDYARGTHGKVAITKLNGQPDWSRIAATTGMSESKIQKIRKAIAKELSNFYT